MIEELQKRTLLKGAILEITERVKAKILKNGFKPKFGARPLRRAISNLLENNLATLFIQKNIKETRIIIDLDVNNKIVINTSKYLIK